jgi:hypothetical protein
VIGSWTRSRCDSFVLESSVMNEDSFVRQLSVQLWSGPIFIFQLNTCGHSLYVTSSLTRGWVCRSQLLLFLASAVILVYQSLGTHEPYFTVSDSRLPQPWGPSPSIYIPQEQGGLVISPGIRFPFRRLLRLAGLWLRYSNPPPHGVLYFVCLHILDWLVI